MKKVTQIFIFAFFLVGALKIKAQKFGYVDYKSSGAYINLSKCLFDDVLASGNYYLVGGYAACNKNWVLDFSFGSVIKHFTEANILGPDQIKGKGIYSAIEWGLNGERFYITNLLSYRYNVSYDFDNDVVFRNAYAACIKFGTVVHLKHKLSLDLGIGGGPKYISSFTSNVSKNSLLKEFPSNKYYYSGSGIYPYLFLEIKLLKKFK